MSKPDYSVSSEYIIGHIDNLDLSDLPTTTDILGQPRLLGRIKHVVDTGDFGFIVTNQKGHSRAKSGNLTPTEKQEPSEIFIHSSDFDGDRLRKGAYITFEINEGNKKGTKALRGQELKISDEDYRTVKQYVDEYSHIRGSVGNKNYDIDIQRDIWRLFSKTVEGQTIVLKDLIQELEGLPDEDRSKKIIKLLDAHGLGTTSISTPLEKSIDENIDPALRDKLREISHLALIQSIEDYNIKMFSREFPVHDLASTERAVFDRLSRDQELNDQCTRFVRHLEKSFPELYSELARLLPGTPSLAPLLFQTTGDIEAIKDDAFIKYLCERSTSYGEIVPLLQGLLSRLDRDQAVSYANYIANSDSASAELRLVIYTLTGDRTLGNSIALSLETIELESYKEEILLVALRELNSSLVNTLDVITDNDLVNRQISAVLGTEGQTESSVLDFLRKLSPNTLSHYTSTPEEVSPSPTLRWALYALTKDNVWLIDESIVEQLSQQAQASYEALHSLWKEKIRKKDKPAIARYIAGSEGALPSLLIYTLCLTGRTALVDRIKGEQKVYDQVQGLVAPLFRDAVETLDATTINRIGAVVDIETAWSSLRTVFGQIKSKDEEAIVGFLSRVSTDLLDLYCERVDETYPSVHLRLLLYKATKDTKWLEVTEIIDHLNGFADYGHDPRILLSHYADEGSDLGHFLSYIRNHPHSSMDLLLYVSTSYEDKGLLQDLIRNRQTLEKMRKLSIDDLALSFATAPDLDEESRRAFFATMGAEKISMVLHTYDEDHRYQYLQTIDDELGLEVVGTYFQDTPLFHHYVGEKWDLLRAEIPYMAFDLRAKGDQVEEFAFIKEDNVRYYDSQDQLRSLERSLKRYPIVVGHDIKRHTMSLLESKGIKTETHIWDTMEIEILLNPCRYSYHLTEPESLQEKTKLVNRLFWNQLYRLSLEPNLCEELAAFLPKELSDILRTLQVPVFAQYFSETEDKGEPFFRQLKPIDASLEERLREIAEMPDSERTLIIAPKSIWPRLALLMPLSFPTETEEDSISYQSVDRERVESSGVLDVLTRTILKRFCEVSRTPIVANIALYLRTQGSGDTSVYLFDERLRPFLYVRPSHIDCIETSGFVDQSLYERNYTHIYAIGTEIHDRSFVQKIDKEYTTEELIDLHSRLPFSMAASNIALLDKEERVCLDIPDESLTANTWAEKSLSGKISIFRNYQYQTLRSNFLSHFSADPVVHPWELASVGNTEQPIVIARLSDPITEDFSGKEKRVSSFSVFRSAYWVAQFALLSEIKERNQGVVLVYILRMREERESLIDYATQLGYDVPREGEGLQQIDLIRDPSRGLVLIDKEDFLREIGTYRTDEALCYVWDDLDIERHMIMWDTLPFDGDDQRSTQRREDEDTVTKSTARQCMAASWPIIRHYYSLMVANNPDTRLYVIDPHLEDYPTPLDASLAKLEEYALWDNNSRYETALAQAGQYFADGHQEETSHSTEEVMEMLRRPFLGTNSDSEPFDWYDYQKPILKEIIEPSGDYLVTLPTGGGKSVLFQAPAIYHAINRHRLSIVISPLLALMQDQVEELFEKGFRTNVDYLSGSREPFDVDYIYRRIVSGELALLYITPERFRVKRFMSALQTRINRDGGLEYVIFDEAHCITQWGQEFRPDYQYALQRCIELKRRYNDFTFSLFSATITAQVESEIREFLPDIKRLGESANPIRDHIDISFASSGLSASSGTQGHTMDERVTAIVDYIKANKIDFQKSRMLIFCRRRRECEEVTDMLSELCKASVADPILRQCADHIDYFHAGLDSQQRSDKYKAFKSSADSRDERSGKDIYILVATKAFGMGMDIPNIHYLVHFSPPSYIEDYLQEVGRVGRSRKMFEDVFGPEGQIPALCINSDEDFRVLKELMISNMLSWSDIVSCKEAVIAFIEKFQTLKETESQPVLVPFNVWQKESGVSKDITSTRIALYWLDHIGHLKTEYLGAGYLTISFSGKSLTGSEHEEVLTYISKQCTDPTGSNIICLRDIQNEFHLARYELMDILIGAVEKELLSINNTLHCSLAPYRYHETRYFLLERKTAPLTLQIILKGLHDFLSSCQVNKEIVLDDEARRDLAGHLLDGIDLSRISVKALDSKKKEVDYMKWRNSEHEAHLSGAVTKLETYTEDITTRTGTDMLKLLKFVPGVSLHIRYRRKQAIYYITVHDKQWEKFLPLLRRDCTSFLESIVTNDRTNDMIEWASDAVKLTRGMKLRSRYIYFSTILQTLSMLRYINHSGLLPSCIECYTTEKSEDSLEGPLEDKSSPLYKLRREFEEVNRVKILRLACMQIYSALAPDRQESFIKRYFGCRNTDEYFTLASESAPEDTGIMQQLTEEALRDEERKLESNPAQLAIYNQPRDANVNVLAGPGSGKTHVLTLRCARLIYTEHVSPNKILVLAYNRAVVTELRNRLNHLFTRLGMSRTANRINVHTFHGLAKKCLGKSLDKTKPELWEYSFYHYLSNNKRAFILRYPEITHILVDEFQDITQVRLDCLLMLHDIYPKASFFTIGDINQSIYGFDRIPRDSSGEREQLSPEEYARCVDPKPYYAQLREAIHPVEMTMFTNYRSYQKILDAAKTFLPDGCQLPKAADVIMKHEPTESYVHISDCDSDNSEEWITDLQQYIDKVRKTGATRQDSHNAIHTIAVFFRTNSEVYRCYAQLQKKLPDDVRLRVQGTSVCELWRAREIYHLIHLLESSSGKLCEIEGDKTATELRDIVEDLRKSYPTWDEFYIDIAYTLSLSYLDSIRASESPHTWQDMADYIRDISSQDDGGVFKIYEDYKAQRLIKDDRLEVILTTMHKVKGLEFDAVFITPSSVGLPIIPHRSDYLEGEYLSADDLADIEEEQKLLYVAYTRAKKYLYVSKGPRERAVESGDQIYRSQDPQQILFIESDPKLGNYNLSYSAGKDYRGVRELIRTQVKRGAAVTLTRDNWGNYRIYQDSIMPPIGILTSSSQTPSRIATNAAYKSVSRLGGFFVSDIVAWTYEETKDEYKKNWGDETIQSGYIYVVLISGVGTPD